MSWTWRWRWWRPNRLEAAVIAVMAILFVVAAYNQGWISPPSWYKPQPEPGDARRSAEEAERAARAASASRLAANSAKFAEEGAASNARSSASSARASASSAVRSEKAADRAEAAVRKMAAKAAPEQQKAPVRRLKLAEKPAAPEATPAQPTAAVEPGSSGEFRWVHFGVAPYAPSREEAMRKREGAFRALGFTEPVVAKLMIATEKPGEKTRINVGDKLGAMLSKGGVVHTNVTAAFGSPSRGMEFAAPAEKWTVTWEGHQYTALLPEVCNNWSSIVLVLPSAPSAAAPLPVERPVAKSSVCPNGWSLTANAWQLDSLPSGMRHEAEALIAAAEARESDNARRLEPYKPDAVSRTMGRRLREQVKVRAPVNADIAVRFIDPQTAVVVRELGTLRAVNGIGTFRFDEDPRPYVVETLWPASFDSPSRSGGERRIRLFGPEWTGICTMNEHGLVRGR